VRYFVTGGTGFLGVYLIRELLSAGHTVVALVRQKSRGQVLVDFAQNVSGSVEFIEGDITDKKSMRSGMQGAEGVFHLAAWYKTGARGAEIARAQLINVDGTRHVLELMRELGISKGVYTSTLAVNSDTRGQMVDESYQYSGPYLSVYERTKAAAHHQVAEPMMAEGLPLVVVMPGLIYGPGDTSSVRRTIIKYLRGKLPVLPSKPEYCWAHVADVAHGHVLAMEKGTSGEKYILAGQRLGFAAAFDLMAEICGVKVTRRRAGPKMLRFMSAFMAAFSWMNLPEDYQPETLRVIAEATYLGSPAKAERELGYQLRPLREGLTEVLQTEMRALGMAFPV
jgi:nucleoside-diphosphate-sugar epimerase